MFLFSQYFIQSFVPSPQFTSSSVSHVAQPNSTYLLTLLLLNDSTNVNFLFNSFSSISLGPFLTHSVSSHPSPLSHSNDFPQSTPSPLSLPHSSPHSLISNPPLSPLPPASLAHPTSPTPTIFCPSNLISPIPSSIFLSPKPKVQVLKVHYRVYMGKGCLSTL